MAKVLYLSYDGMTDPLGQSQVLTYLIGLAKKGHEIHLVSFEKQENEAVTATIEAVLQPVKNLYWHPLPYTKSPPVLSTIKDIRALFSKAKSLHAKHKFQIIHCRSYITALVGLSFQKNHGTRFVFDMRGFWADERVEGYLWNLKNPVYNLVYRFFKKKEKRYILESDAIVSLTHAGKTILKEMGAESNKIKVIPCCVDLALFDPTTLQPNQKEQQKRDLNLLEFDYVLGYVGSIGTWYQLPEMLAFFKVLMQKINAVFLFVSRHPKEDLLLQAKKMGIPENRIRITSGTLYDMPKLIHAFDASIFFIQPSFSKQASSPTKMAELMAMQKPLVCNTGVGDVGTIVQEYKAGVTLSSYSDDQLNLAAEALLSLPKTIPHTMDAFSAETGIQAYHSVYQSLI